MSMNLGINLVEVDGATPSIQGAPTSVSGFVIRSQRGVPGAVRQISNFTQFTDYFGGYVNGKDTNNIQQSYVGAYAIRGFFDNGGTLAYVTRAVASAAVAVPSGGSGVAVTPATAASFTTSLVLNGSVTALTLTAAFRSQVDPGAWGNSLAVSIVSNLNVANGFDVTVLSVTTASGVTTTKVLETWSKLVIGGAPGAQDPSVINDPNTGSKYVAVTIGTFPAWQNGQAYAVGAYAANGGNVYVVTGAGTSDATGPAGTGTGITDGTVVWAFVPPAIGPKWAASTAYGAGAYVTNGAILYKATTGGTSAATGGGPTGTGTLTDGTVTWASVSGYSPLVNGADDNLSAATTETLDTVLAAAFTTPSPFDPLPVELLACPESASQSVVAEALNYAIGRGDCMFVGHVPDFGSQPLAAAKTYGQQFQGDKVYGALYLPYIQVVDPIGSLIWIPPTGHILGVYARTDQQRGIWKAPAGDAAVVGNALDVRATLNDVDFTDLVKNGSVNAIRPIQGAGIVIDSSRTLSTNTLWLYVNVRLLFNYVKTSLKLGLRWVVQEPNDTTLWNKIKFNSVTPFLMGLWRSGAFGPGAPKDVFTVKVDAENNPPTNIQQGILNIEIYFFPSRPAETIVITVGQQEGAATASEG
jgi:phage tail sheath protein FI